MPKQESNEKKPDTINSLQKKVYPKTTGREKLEQIYKVLLYLGFGVLLFGFGALATAVYYKLSRQNSSCEKDWIETLAESGEDEQGFEYIPQEPIRAPLNGVILTDEEYELLNQNIPHAVLISNNESARDEQYGLSNADVVYEAEVEGGITRFMALFWTNQEDFKIKPVRSVRKCFFDWALEYGKIPVTFTGFAKTNNDDTNSWGVYKKYAVRVTYFDWPFLKDDECLATHPAMHCKRVETNLLYDLFEKHGWTFESWSGTFDRTGWEFAEEVDLDEYDNIKEFTYDFSWAVDWSSRWVYSKSQGEYLKYEPDDFHRDMNNQLVITASTVVIQKTERIYTEDSEGRVAYKTIGSGDAYVLRDGKKIDAVWEKICDTCRTEFYLKLKNGRYGDKVIFKPGLIWIAVVPTDKEVRWGSYSSTKTN